MSYLQDFQSPYFQSISDTDFVNAWIVSNRLITITERSACFWYHSNLIFDFKKVNRIRNTLLDQKVLEVVVTKFKVPKFFTEVFNLSNYDTNQKETTQNISNHNHNRMG